MSGKKKISKIFFDSKKDRELVVNEKWFYETLLSVDPIISKSHGYDYSKDLSDYSSEAKEHCAEFLTNYYYEGCCLWEENFVPVVIGFSSHEKDECSSFWLTSLASDGLLELLRAKDRDGNLQFIPMKIATNVILKQDPNDSSNYYFKLRFAAFIKVDDDNVFFLPLGMEIDWCPLKFKSDLLENNSLEGLVTCIGYQSIIDNIFHLTGKGDFALKHIGHKYNEEFRELYNNYQGYKKFNYQGPEVKECEEKLNDIYKNLHVRWDIFCEKFDILPESLKIILSSQETLEGELAEIFFKKHAC